MNNAIPAWIMLIPTDALFNREITPMEFLEKMEQEAAIPPKIVENWRTQFQQYNIPINIPLSDYYKELLI